MNHGISNTILYAACKITVRFVHRDFGNENTIRGTCFFTVNKRGDVCLITNRHVVDPLFKQDKYQNKGFRIDQVIVENHSSDSKTSMPDIISQITIKNIHDFLFAADEENDIACLCPVMAEDGTEIAFSIPYKLIADAAWLNGKLNVCDFVGFPGFPDWYDKANNSPIFRTGTIASDPRYNYSNEEFYTGERIAYEAFSFGGSSGSPVFALQKGFPVFGILKSGPTFYREVKMIGINGGHLFQGEQQHSGISYFYKSSAILELIDR